MDSVELLTPYAREIHGSFNLPPGYRLAFVPKYATFIDPGPRAEDYFISHHFSCMQLQLDQNLNCFGTGNLFDYNTLSSSRRPDH